MEFKNINHVLLLSVLKVIRGRYGVRVQRKDVSGSPVSLDLQPLISCNITEIYSDDVSQDAAKTVTEMMNLREEMVKQEN